jgi:hypothetical protein
MSGHRCVAGRRCRNAVLEDNVRVGVVIAEEYGLCKGCYANVRRVIGQLQDDWERLSAAVGLKMAGNQARVSGTRELSIPLNTTVLALRSSLSEWCEVALWMVAKSLGIDVRERHKAKGWPVKEYPVVMQAACVLPENLSLLLAAESQPVSVWNKDSEKWSVVDRDGINVALKLVELHHSVLSILGEKNLRQKFSLPCPNLDCGMIETLGIDNGCTDVSCLACGRHWTQDEYDWLAHVLISEHEKSEVEVLKWCLAESQWQRDVALWLLAEREWRNRDIVRLSTMEREYLHTIDGWAVIQLLRELIRPLVILS